MVLTTGYTSGCYVEFLAERPSSADGGRACRRSMSCRRAPGQLQRLVRLFHNSVKTPDPLISLDPFDFPGPECAHGHGSGLELEQHPPDGGSVGSGRGGDREAAVGEIGDVQGPRRSTQFVCRELDVRVGGHLRVIHGDGPVHGHGRGRRGPQHGRSVFDAGQGIALRVGGSGPEPERAADVGPAVALDGGDHAPVVREGGRSAVTPEANDVIALAGAAGSRHDSDGIDGILC